MLINATAASAPSAHPYTDRGILGGDGGNWGVAFTTSGVTAFHYDGTIYQVATKPCALNGWHAIDVSYAATALTISVDGVASVPTSTGALPNSAGNFIVGSQFNSSVFFAGSIADIMIAKTSLAATSANIISYYNARYALSI